MAPLASGRKSFPIMYVVLPGVQRSLINGSLKRSATGAFSSGDSALKATRSRAGSWTAALFRVLHHHCVWMAANNQNVTAPPSQRLCGCLWTNADMAVTVPVCTGFYECHNKKLGAEGRKPLCLHRHGFLLSSQRREFTVSSQNQQRANQGHCVFVSCRKTTPMKYDSVG